MELTSGVKNYLDELVNDDSIFLVLIYGSSATGHASNSSDLDVFVCGNLGACYRRAVVIDNKELEINFIDFNYIDAELEKSIEDNNSYYESVLKNNIVLKNSYFLIDKLKTSLECMKRDTKKANRKMPLKNQYLLSEFYKGMREDLYSYFNFLDEVRTTMAYIYNYSTLHVGKVYEIYSNKEHAVNDYCLNLPTDEFISRFDSAIRKTFDNDSITWFMDSVKFEPLPILGDCLSFSYVDQQRIKTILIHMNKLVNRTIRYLIENNPYKEYLYHVVVNHLFRFYKEIYGSVTEEFLKILECAKVETDTSLRINFLRELFVSLEGKYAFDYKNYTLYFN